MKSSDMQAKQALTFQVTETYFICGIASHRHTTEHAAAACKKRQNVGARSAARMARILDSVRLYIGGATVTKIAATFGVSTTTASMDISKARRCVLSEARAQKKADHFAWLANAEYWREDNLNVEPIDIESALNLLTMYAARKK